MSNPTITNNDLRPIVVSEFTTAEDVTIAQDAGGVIPAGAVLGKRTVGAAGAAAATGGNTGNGTVSTPSKLAGAKAGVYRIEFISATVFEVIGPDGKSLGEGRNGVAFTREIAFTVTAGGNAFVAGDSFTITVAAGDGKVLRSVSTATDGTQLPKYVTSQEIDATAGDRATVQVVKKGKIRKDALFFAGSEVFTTVVSPTGKTFGELLEETGILAIPGETIGRYDNQ